MAINAYGDALVNSIGPRLHHIINYLLISSLALGTDSLELHHLGQANPSRKMPRHVRESRFDEMDFYEDIQHIGEGGQGTCSLVRRCRDSQLLVLKTIPKPKYSQGLPIDIRILRDLLPTHKRIASLANSCIFPDRTELFLEFCDGGDLQDLIDQYDDHATKIPESFLWHAFIQLSEALAFLHYGWNLEDHGPITRSTAPWKRIIHRDIKPANVFLKFRTHHHWLSGYPDLKLGDFGLAAVTSDPDHTADSYCGTYAWQPLERPEATAKGDVWALGAIIHALAHDGHPPLSDPPPSRPWLAPCGTVGWDELPRARQPTSVIGAYSPTLDRWMMKCFRRKPTQRVTSMELVTEMAPVGRRKMMRQWWPLRRWAFDGLNDIAD